MMEWTLKTKGVYLRENKELVERVREARKWAMPKGPGFRERSP